MTSTFAPVSPNTKEMDSIFMAKKQNNLKSPSLCVTGLQVDVPDIAILKKINFESYRGELQGILGPSGAGKSTLLRCLAGKRIEGTHIGAFTLHGQLMEDRENMCSKIAFLEQEECLIGTQTVFEALMFVARLYYSSTSYQESKLKRLVSTTIDKLGLSHRRDTLIGDVTFKSLSGGEKRRVSIGEQLVKNPDVILLDEPTSGLDSKNAIGIMLLLKDLASKGSTVITSLHQPSSRITALFDRVCLMTNGHVIFNGTVPRCLKFFSSNGYPCPKMYNPSDHFLDCLSERRFRSGRVIGGGATRISPVDYKKKVSNAGDIELGMMNEVSGMYPSSLGVQGADLSANRKLSENSVSQSDNKMQYSPPLQPSISQRNFESSTNVLEKPSSSNKDGASGSAPNPLLGDKASLMSPTVSTVPPTKPSNSGYSSPRSMRGDDDDDDRSAFAGRFRYNFWSKEGQWSRNASRGASASWWLQYRMLTTRKLQQWRRNPILFMSEMLQFILKGVYIGSLYHPLPSDLERGSFERFASLFTLLAAICFTPIFTAISVFQLEKYVLRKEVPTGLYSLSAYLAGLTTTSLFIESIMSMMYCIVTYWFLGLQDEGIKFFIFYYTLTIFIMISESMGLICVYSGQLLGSGGDGDSLTFFLITPIYILITLSGFLAVETPIYYQWIQWINYFHYTTAILVENEMSGLTFRQEVAPGVEVEIDGVDAIRDSFRNGLSLSENLVIITSMFVITRTLSFLALIRIKDFQ